MAKSKFNGKPKTKSNKGTPKQQAARAANAKKGSIGKGGSTFDREAWVNS